MQISIVIPVFNSDKSLVSLERKIVAYFEGKDLTYQVVFVDDGSSNPNTWKTLQSISKSNSNVLAVRFRKNFGKPNALLCGFRHAKGDYILTLDDDLQHLPNVLDDLLPLKEHDVVIGKYKESKHNFIKRLLSTIYFWLEVWAYKKPSDIIVTPIKLLKREIVNDIVNIHSSHPFIAALIFRVTDDVVNVSVEHGERVEGKSGFTFNKMLQTISNMLFNNSSILLKGIAVFGVLSFVITGIVTISMFYLGQIEPDQKLLIAVAFSTSLILFSIGIVGEYLIRIISGIETKQGYYIKEVIEHEA